MADTGPVGVLHVDDDPALLDLITTFLEQLDTDARLVSAADGSEALELLRVVPEAIDVVVSDFSLEDTGGIEFLEAVRAEATDLPFIFYTGRTDKEEVALEHGATDFIVKGSAETLHELAHRIVEVTDSPADEPRVEPLG